MVHLPYEFARGKKYEGPMCVHAWPYAAAWVLASWVTIAASPQAQAAKKTIWDGVYTKEQAERGKDVYADVCARCHGTNLIGGEVAGEVAPDLKGVYFILRWSDPVYTLFTKIEDTMPKGEAGTISSQEAADIIAYLLQSNDAPAGTSEVPSNRAQASSIVITRKPN